MVKPAKETGLRHGLIVDDRYRIGAELGRGAMGIVYEAQHTRLERRVAIKVLHEELTSDGDACERFEREARAAGRIGSQHIVNVHDAGELPEGRRYLVMEYLRGETLKAYFDRLAPVPPADLMAIMAQLLDGLAAAHDAGIVHRDIKPENIYLVETADEPLVKIVDFGVSKFRDTGAGALKSRTGVVLGTPHYMAPEQARGLRDVDRRADVFSAGVVLYEGLCGRRPFNAPNVNQLLFHIALDDVPPIEQRTPGIDQALAAIVRCATMRNADERYQSARQFADDVVAWLHGDEVEALENAPPASASTPEDRPMDEPLDEETRDAALASLPPPAPEPAPTREPPSTAPAARHGASRWLALAAILALGAAIMVRLSTSAASVYARLPIPQLVISEPPPREPQVEATEPPATATASSPKALPLRPLPAGSAGKPASSHTPRPYRKDL